jgi:hypothetical protein
MGEGMGRELLKAAYGAEQIREATPGEQAAMKNEKRKRKGRYQFAYHVIQLGITQKAPKGYKTEVCGSYRVAISIQPTHIFDYNTDIVEPLDKTFIGFKRLLRREGPRFNGYEDLEALCNPNGG